jgi:cytochrome c peroxidase
VRPRAAIERGAELFASRCARCHAPPSYTSPKQYDVGLADEAGDRDFNPPSLRGVGLRAPLLHDGRAATLEEVLGKFGHPAALEKLPREIADLVAFLRSL